MEPLCDPPPPMSSLESQCSPKSHVPATAVVAALKKERSRVFISAEVWDPAAECASVFRASCRTAARPPAAASYYWDSALFFQEELLFPEMCDFSEVGHTMNRVCPEWEVWGGSTSSSTGTLTPQVFGRTCFLFSCSLTGFEEFCSRIKYPKKIYLILDN